jgi:hypothetical protein
MALPVGGEDRPYDSIPQKTADWKEFHSSQTGHSEAVLLEFFAFRFGLLSFDEKDTRLKSIIIPLSKYIPKIAFQDDA